MMPKTNEPSVRAKRKLNPRQKRFCEEYVKTGNATLSYMVAYEKDKSTYKASSVEANRLMKTEAVLEYIAELTKIKNPLLTEEWLCDRLLAIINNPDTKEQDRLKAIDMLLKCLGAYTVNQKIDANITGEQTIRVTIEEDDDDE